MTTPSIIAHRGYSALYRENSPAAWAGAVEANADHIEVDVRQPGTARSFALMMTI